MSVITIILGWFGITPTWNEEQTTENGIIEYTNVKYGERERELVDIYIPEGVSGTVSVILSIHGGAWVTGDKSSYTEESKYAAEIGYIGATLNYTYISETTHCDLILDEITMALKKVCEKAAEKGITVDKYFIRGASAGGHLATLYAYSRGGESGVQPAFVHNMCGPNALEYLDALLPMLTSNTLGTADYLCQLIGNLAGVTITADTANTPEVAAALQQVSATHFVSTAVPTITSHGTLDTIVPYLNATILDGLLEQQGVEHVLYTYTTSGHGLENNSELDKEVNAKALEWCGIYLSCGK